MIETAPIVIDDDVEFLYQQDSESMGCHLCTADLTFMTPEKRNSHYVEVHFTAPSQPEASTSKYTGSSEKQPESYNKYASKLKATFKTRKFNSRETDVFWYPSQTAPPPENYTPALIPVLKKALIKSHAKGQTQKACLCTDQVAHVNVEPFDRGWGCGYRNFLMACTALMVQSQQPDYFPLLDHPYPPGVHSMQRWIEEAWAHGYDKEGASQLKHKLVGTRKWIGTAELYVAFSFRGIPSQLVDFDLKKCGMDGFLNWIVKYFSHDAQRSPKQVTVNEALRGATPVIVTNKMPLILQHAGHSRTIVGFERSSNGMINLLIFDPSRRIPSDVRIYALSIRSQSPQTPGQPNKHNHRVSPSNALNHLLHPSTSKGHKRSCESSDGSSAKRMRAGTPEDVIVIDSDDDDEQAGQSSRKSVSTGGVGQPPWPDASSFLKLFRVNSKALEKHDKYQILYLPLTNPLDKDERLARQIVTSAKVA